MTWKAIKIEKLDWLAPPAGDKPSAAKAAPIDPYVLWAAATQFSSYTDQPEFSSSRPDESLVSIIARAEDAKSVKDLAETDWLNVPPAYLAPVPGSGDLSCYFTARVTLNNLYRLRGLEGLAEWELGLPLISTPGPRLQLNGAERAVRRSATTGATTQTSSRSADDPQKPVIGIIDYGCAFLNTQFRRADSETRVSRLWDQGKPAKDNWLQPGKFGYGREMTAEQIDPMLEELKRRHTNGDAADETEFYTKCDYLVSDETDATSMIATSTHGTSVLDLAAGRFDPISGMEDKASEADIMFVQLPLLTASDSSGGSLGVHVLDGIRYILSECSDDTKIVINLSYGTQAGPHDGSTLLERAMDDLLKLRTNDFAIVLAAGNQRQARGHVKGTTSKGNPLTFLWNVLDTDPTDSFVEVWYPRKGVNGKDAELTVVVISPTGERCSKAGKGKRIALYANGSCVAAVFHEDHVPNGADPMILVALGPSSALPGDLEVNGRATPGIWKIVLQSEDPLEIHAWIERDEPPTRGPRRQSVFQGDGICEEGTLNSLATGEHTVVVGGFRLADGEEVAYSGCGPTRGGRRTDACPSILGACEENEALPGMRVTAVRSGNSDRFNGTSAAAPVIARRLMNKMMTSDEPIVRSDWGSVLEEIAATPCARAVPPPARPSEVTQSTNEGAVASQSAFAPAAPPEDTPQPTDPSSVDSPSHANNPPDLQFPYASESFQ